MPLEPCFSDLKYVEYTSLDNFDVQEWTWQDRRHSINDHPSLIFHKGNITEKLWHCHGILHRDRTCGPALERSDGLQAWYMHGNRHRPGGPAFIRPDGYQEWYLNNKLHRTDGPAVIEADGSQAWWLNGQEYDLDSWLEANDELSFEEKVWIKMKYA